MKKSILIWVLLMIYGMLPPGALWAQTPLFFDDMGAGHRATAMGQAFTAVADDPSAAYYNPAGLNQLPSAFMLTLGYQYSKPMIYMDVRDKAGLPYVQHPYLEQRNVSRSEDVGTRGLFVGAAGNFAHFSVFKDPPSFMRRIAFGFTGFFSTPDLVRFWNPQREQDPYHMRYSFGYCLLNIALSTSIKLTDYLSVGIGVMPRADTFQQTTNSYIDLIKMKENIKAGIPLLTDTYRVRLKTQVRLYATYLFGILFRPPVFGLEDKVTLGVSYRRELSGYYGTGPSSDDLVLLDPVTGDKYIILALNARSVDYIGYNPAQITAGLALKLVDGLTLAADLTWKQYSEFKFFWALPPDPFFNDTWIPRVGLEYFFEPGLKARYLKEIDKFIVQGGYYHEPSPVPDMNGAMNILDSDMNVFSVGLGMDYLLKGVRLLKVQTYFQLHLAEERILSNENDPLFGVIKTGGEVYSAGINLSIQL